MKYFSLILVLMLFGCRYNNTSPEIAATKFCSNLGIKIQGVPNCTGEDTDNDGYVTCTVALAVAEGQPVKTMSLQCAVVTGIVYNTTFAEGCKETQPKINVQNN